MTKIKKNNIGSYDYRLFLLSFITVTIFICYWFLIEFTLILRFCSPATDFWFTSDPWQSPFIIYEFLIYTLFIWLGVEFLLFAVNKKLTRFKMISMLSILIALSGLTFGHYRLYQTLQASRGELYFYDIWPNAGWVPVIYKENYFNLTLWQDYLYRQSCKMGFDPHQLSRVERERLYQEYELLHEQEEKSIWKR